MQRLAPLAEHREARGLLARLGTISAGWRSMTLHVVGPESQPISSRSGALTRKREVPGRTILERLKLETAAEHAAIEDATGVMDPELSLADYRAYLERSFAFYQAVEEQFRQLEVWEALRPASTRLYRCCKLPGHGGAASSHWHQSCSCDPAETLLGSSTRHPSVA